jgi:hypothetical protein
MLIKHLCQCIKSTVLKLQTMDDIDLFLSGFIDLQLHPICITFTKCQSLKNEYCTNMELPRSTNLCLLHTSGFNGFSTDVFLQTSKNCQIIESCQVLNRRLSGLNKLAAHISSSSGFDDFLLCPTHTTLLISRRQNIEILFPSQLDSWYSSF